MKKYQNIWESAVPYLKQGINKNFIIHTEGVVKAMELILKKEKGDPDILIPAAMLHDVGWANVPKKYQRTKDNADKLRGMKLHITLAPEIIKKILQSVNYKAFQINEVIEIVQAHKFSKPRKLSKKMLIDADQLSDAFKEQFYSDVKTYNSTPEKLYNFRMNDNNFYTKVAKDIFLEQMKQRRSEFESI
ncbi:MAG: HD domain-containing protein [Candidatus Moranbacteria bacterium]|jgi:HD superfamily phosphodiesterase|nr:HD domain-containing protein [Candidatus Moranbacteria bacterium]